MWILDKEEGGADRMMVFRRGCDGHIKAGDLSTWNDRTIITSWGC